MSKEPEIHTYDTRMFKGKADLLEQLKARDHALALARVRLKEMQRLYVLSHDIDLWTMHPKVRDELLAAIEALEWKP